MTLCIQSAKLILFYVFSKISHWKNKIITKNGLDEM